MQIILILIACIAIATAGILLTLKSLRQHNDRKREKQLVFLQILMPKKDSKEDKEQESEQFSF